MKYFYTASALAALGATATAQSTYTPGSTYIVHHSSPVFNYSSSSAPTNTFSSAPSTTDASTRSSPTHSIASSFDSFTTGIHWETASDSFADYSSSSPTRSVEFNTGYHHGTSSVYAFSSSPTGSSFTKSFAAGTDSISPSSYASTDPSPTGAGWSSTMTSPAPTSTGWPSISTEWPSAPVDWSATSASSPTAVPNWASTDTRVFSSGTEWFSSGIDPSATSTDSSVTYTDSYSTAPTRIATETYSMEVPTTSSTPFGASTPVPTEFYATATIGRFGRRL